MKKIVIVSLISLSAFAADGPDIRELKVQKTEGEASTAPLITVTIEGKKLLFNPAILNRSEVFSNMCQDFDYKDHKDVSTKVMQSIAQHHVFEGLTQSQAKQFLYLLNVKNVDEMHKHLAQYIFDDVNEECENKDEEQEEQKEQACKDLLALYQKADYLHVPSVQKVGKQLIAKTDIKVDRLPRQLSLPIMCSRVNKALLGLCGLQQTVLRSHTGRVYSAAFSPDGKQIVSASWDYTVRIWDTDTGACLRTLQGHTFFVSSAAFSPDGKQIASALSDNTVRIWDAQTGDCLHTLEGHGIESAVFSPDGKQIALALWDKTVRIWDIDTSVCLHTLEGHDKYVSSVVFSPDGKQIASVSYDKTVRIWGVQKGACLHTLRGHTGWVYSAAFSPDGKQIASVSGDNTVRIWNAQTGDCLHTLRGHTLTVSSVAFSPDGKQIASASDDRTVRIWDTDTGVCLHMLQGHTSDVNSAAFSPDSKQIVLASDDYTVRIWDTDTGVCLHMLQGHTGWVSSVAFSPDGKQIVSASDDKTVRIWRDYKKWLKLCPYELIQLLDKARISWQEKTAYQLTEDDQKIIDEYDQHALLVLLKDERLFNIDSSEG